MRAFILLLCIGLFSCNSNEEVTAEEQTIASTDTTNHSIETEIASDTLISYSTETFQTEEQGWGYNILKNGKQYIHQPHIPAVQGVKGFSSEEKAATTADYAIYKIHNGIIPPTISSEELDSLGVLD
jgi:hypothetical protein